MREGHRRETREDKYKEKDSGASCVDEEGGGKLQRQLLRTGHSQRVCEVRERECA